MGWQHDHYLVNVRWRFVYCAIPKVACTSIKTWFLQLEGTPPEQARPSLHVYLENTASLSKRPQQQAAAALQGDYFRFVFVRNPWSRLVSAYLNKVVGRDGPGLQAIKSVQKGQWWNVAQRARYYGRKLRFGSGVDVDRGITFREFVETLSELTPADMNEHWRPQSFFFEDRDVDFIGRFESLADHFKYVCKVIGAGDTLPRLNASRRTTSLTDTHELADCPPPELRKLKALPDYRSFYDRSLADKVGDIYRVDATRFCYDFSSPRQTDGSQPQLAAH